MKNIQKLFDKEYVRGFFKDYLLDKYDDFKDIEKVDIKPYKKYIWKASFHVVIGFKVFFIDKEGKKKMIPIFCSAHSHEPRKNVYDALVFLWDSGLNDEYMSTPKPLFYSDKFKAIFYEGPVGLNLYRYIRKNMRKEIDEMIPKIAEWFAKLHSLDTTNAKNFNPGNSRIETVVPGFKHVLRGIKRRLPKYYEDCKKIYEIFIKREEEFLASTDKIYLVHGDAHPENMIRMEDGKLAVIDFSDLCLSDFARDLGCFLQQLEYMSIRKIGDQEYVDSLKKSFLDNYFKNVKIKLTPELEKRINMYYDYTAIRTATFLAARDEMERERVIPLIEAVKNNLKIC